MDQGKMLIETYREDVRRPVVTGRCQGEEALPVAGSMLRSCLEQLVAAAFQLDEKLLRQPTRGRAEVARARQVAMYLAHTTWGFSLTEVGEMFERDRTTVAHACSVVEDCRECPHFDDAIEMLEWSARVAQAHAALPAMWAMGRGH